MVQLVGEVGYANVTMRALNRLARVSTETFYAQFDGKEDCLVDAYAWTAARIRARLGSARVDRLSRPRQAERAISRLARDLVADPHAARLLLIEAYAGGPAALRQIRNSETELSRTLRGALDRRGDRITPAMSRWLVAGALHIARQRTFVGRISPLEASDFLALWSRRNFERPAPIVRRRGAVNSDPQSAGTVEPFVRDAEASDREVVLATVLRLARSGGYWRLSARRIREATGLSATRFNREFRSVDECYLTALRLLGRHYFRAPASVSADWPGRISGEIDSLCDRVAADAELARLLFVEILAPGVPGLKCRERMIVEQADRCRDRSTSTGAWPPPLLTASTAGLWALICNELEAGRAGRLPETAPTFSFLVLSPSIGAQAAAAAVQTEDTKHYAAHLDH